MEDTDVEAPGSRVALLLGWTGQGYVLSGSYRELVREMERFVAVWQSALCKVTVEGDCLSAVTFQFCVCQMFI